MQYYTLYLHLTTSDTCVPIKWAVSLVVEDAHFNPHHWYMWMCISKRTHSISLEDVMKDILLQPHSPIDVSIDYHSEKH